MKNVLLSAVPWGVHKVEAGAVCHKHPRCKQQCHEQRLVVIVSFVGIRRLAAPPPQAATKGLVLRQQTSNAGRVFCFELSLARPCMISSGFQHSHVFCKGLFSRKEQLRAALRSEYQKVKFTLGARLQCIHARGPALAPISSACGGGTAVRPTTVAVIVRKTSRTCAVALRVVPPRSLSGLFEGGEMSLNRLGI